MSRKRIEEEQSLSSPLERFEVETAKAMARMERNNTPGYIRDTFKAVTELLVKTENSFWMGHPITSIRTGWILNYGDIYLKAAGALIEHDYLTQYQPKLQENLHRLEERIDVEGVLEIGRVFRLLTTGLAQKGQAEGIPGRQLAILSDRWQDLATRLTMDDSRPDPSVVEVFSSGRDDYPYLFNIYCFNSRVVHLSPSFNPHDERFGAPRGMGNWVVLINPEAGIVNRVTFHTGSENKPGEMMAYVIKKSFNLEILTTAEERFVSETEEPKILEAVAEQIIFVCQVAEKGVREFSARPTRAYELLSARGLVFEKIPLPPQLQQGSDK